jgi:hypothetical protein
VKKHIRKFEYLKLYVSEEPKNADERRKDKENWELARNILAIRKAEYIQGKYHIKDNKKGQITFLDYYEKLKEDRYATKGNYDNWDAALKHIERYIVNRIYQNTGRVTNTGVELLLSQDLTTNWQVSGSLNSYSNAIDDFQGTLLFPFEGDFTIDASTANAYDAKINTEVIFPKEFSVQLTGIYFSKRNIPQGEKLARSSVDFGIKKSLWDKKAELTLSASDIFNRFGIQQWVANEGFKALYQNFYETQIFRLGFKYKI